MKGSSILAIGLLLGSQLHAQWGNREDYFEEEREKHYFVSAGFGKGRTSWYSRTTAYELYDTRGKKVLSGDHRLSALTIHRTYRIGVVAPVGRFRMGMGIEFDEFFLNHLYIQDPAISKPISMIEEFRFDKFHLTLEFPFDLENEDLDIAVSLKGGYYAFSQLDSFSLFGNKGSGDTFFGSLGPTVAFNVHEGAYIYLQPYLEYRYFDNSGHPPSGTIHHRLYSYGMNGGLRYKLL